MDTITEQRKYALTKLGTGDYVCPSNDGRTLWRFSSYEDGKCAGLDVDYESRVFWMVRSASFPIGARDFADVEWRDVEYYLPTARARTWLGGD